MPRRTPLCKLLQSHRPANAEESAFREDMLALISLDPDPFSRHEFYPGHFTASAFLLSPEKDSLLLIFHSKLQRWLQPGGHIDPSDPTPLAGALRELSEETGVQQLTPFTSGLFDVDIHEIPPRKSEPGHKHFDLRFAFVAQTKQVQAASDALDARWVKLHEINALESDASVMRAVSKLISMTKDKTA